MNEIQDEAYSEAMDEIERLEQLNDDLIADKNRITELAKQAVVERDAEIKRLKAQIAKLKQLADNAADALGGCTWVKRDRIISELRKTAE